MVIIIAGAGKLFEKDAVRISVGLAGGVFLVLMGVQFLLLLRKDSDGPDVAQQRHPFVTGIVLTGANPYFLVWWATVGLALATQAVELGMLAFLLFAVVHWLCDLVWLEALSLASFKGAELFGRHTQRWVLAVCGIMLLGFGGKFLIDAGSRLGDAAFDVPEVEGRSEIDDCVKPTVYSPLPSRFTDS